MPVTTDFRVFQIAPMFAGVQKLDGNIIVAKATAAGKPLPFSFMLAVNFERGSDEDMAPHSGAIKVQATCRVSFAGRPIRITPVNEVIPQGQWSRTTELGLHEVAINNAEISDTAIPLTIEFLDGQKVIASDEYQVKFCRE